MPTFSSREALPWLNSLAVFGRTLAIVWGIDAHHRTRRVLRYLVRSLLHPRLAIAWSEYVLESPECSLWKKFPRLLLKPGRPYHNRRLGYRQRTKIIAAHYRLLHCHFPFQTVVRLADGRAEVLFTCTGKYGTEYQVTLERTCMFDREGELLVSLQLAADGSVVSRCAFSFADFRSRPSCEIGCVQGAKGDAARERIRAATRELFGWRPKNLLLDTVGALAQSLGISEIYGVSNSCRVFDGRSIHADYDAFWCESGGVAGDDGMFRLPAMAPCRDPADVPRNRRGEYRKRQVLREVLRSSVACVLGASREDGGETLAGYPLPRWAAHSAYARAVAPCIQDFGDTPAC